MDLVQQPFLPAPLVIWANIKVLREAKLSLVSPARPGHTGKGLLRAATRLGSTELPELLRKMKQKEDSYYDPSVSLASFPMATWFQRRGIPLDQRPALSLQE